MGRGDESLIAKSRSHGASMGRGDESLIAKSRSHDQDGRYAHIW